MKKILGFLIVALTFSIQVMADSSAGNGNDSKAAPPFASMTCEAENVSVQVEIQNSGQTNGTGPAVVNANGRTLNGEWHWEAAPEGTRLTGFHFLKIGANSLDGNFAFYLRTHYAPEGRLSGGWLEMTGVSDGVECKITQ